MASGLMPGETQIVEGKVDEVITTVTAPNIFEVEGLQQALEKWVGRKVSIIIEDVTEGETK